jgi:hypothetical protein
MNVLSELTALNVQARNSTKKAFFPADPSACVVEVAGSLI